MINKEKFIFLIKRIDILVSRIQKLYIIQKDIYPMHFIRINRLIVKNEKKLSIINKLIK